MPGPYVGASWPRKIKLPMIPPMAPHAIRIPALTARAAESMTLDWLKASRAGVFECTPIVAKKMPKYRTWLEKP